MDAMTGPLPTLYRIVIVVTLLVICAAAGAWLGASPSLPFLFGSGLVGGAVVGGVLAYALLRQPHR